MKTLPKFQFMVFWFAVLANLVSFGLPAMSVSGWYRGAYLRYGYQCYSQWFIDIVLAIGIVAAWQGSKNSIFAARILTIVALLLLALVFFMNTALFALEIKVGYWLWFGSSAIIALTWAPISTPHSFSSRSRSEK